MFTFLQLLGYMHMGCVVLCFNILVYMYFLEREVKFIMFSIIHFYNTAQKRIQKLEKTHFLVSEIEPKFLKISLS